MIIAIDRFYLAEPVVDIVCLTGINNESGVFMSDLILTHDVTCFQCPSGTEWDEKCQECVCTVICDGTIASMIRSIVL